MTAKEARLALGEMVTKVGAKHAEEIERSRCARPKKPRRARRSP